MTWKEVFQILCDPNKPGRFSREEVRKLSWAYVFNVLFCHKDEKGMPTKFVNSTRSNKKEDGNLKLYWQRGYPPHIIDRIISQNKQAEKKVVKGRRRWR